MVFATLLKVSTCTGREQRFEERLNRIAASRQRFLNHYRVFFRTLWDCSGGDTPCSSLYSVKIECPGTEKLYHMLIFQCMVVLGQVWRYSAD